MLNTTVMETSDLKCKSLDSFIVRLAKTCTHTKTKWLLYDLKIDDLKIDDLKIDDLKIDDLKIDDLKIGTSNGKLGCCVQ